VVTQGSRWLQNSIMLSPLSGVDVQTINQLAKFLARFEKGNSLRWHFDSRSSFWIACDARSSLARVEASESADFHLVAGSKSADDAVKYGADDDVGFLLGQLNDLVNPFGQIGPGHLAHSRCITKESNTVLLVARAQAVSPQVESGNVYLPHPAIASWVEAFVEECATFPNAKYDDQVDQMSQALNRLRTMGSVPKYTPPIPRPPSGDRGWMV
jgi:hypothetical protein